jgi:DNA invertase Pin-like site-specific DNA recombinase
VLGALAQFERDLIRACAGEGRTREKVSGVKLGRRPKLTPHQHREALLAARAASPSPKSRAATMSATVRFHG